MENKFSRGAFAFIFPLIPTALIGVAFIACNTPAPPTKPTVREVIGTPEPAVGEPKVRGMLEALRITGVPVLLMAASQIDHLRQASSTPPEFPPWMNRDIAPLSITVGNGPSTSLFLREVDRDPAKQVNIVGAKTPPIDGIKTYHYRGIRLDGELLKQPDIVGGLVLAQEHLAAMFKIGSSAEFHDLLRRLSVPPLVGEKNAIIFDRKKQREAGAALYTLWLLTNSNPYIDTAIEGIRTFPIGDVLMNLIGKGSLKPNEGIKYLKSIHRGAAVLDTSTQIGFKTTLERLIVQWIASGKYLPPYEMIEFAHSNVMRDAVLELKNLP